MKTAGTVFLMLLAQVFSGCDNDAGKEMKQDAARALKEAQNHLVLNKDEYIKKVEGELEKIDEQIKMLKTRAEKSGAKTRVEVIHEIQELLTKKEAVRKNLDRLKLASAKTVDQAESEMDAALEDLKKSYEKTRSRFE